MPCVQGVQSMENVSVNSFPQQPCRDADDVEDKVVKGYC